jgi:flagellar hook-associated protein 1 FlgK
MTLMTALSAAVSGLRTTQAGIANVSQNIANADSAGYTKRRLQPVEQVAGDRSAGVRSGEVQRVLDRAVQRQLWQENSGAGYTGLRAGMSGALERLYGPPGSPSALDTLLNQFSAAVGSLNDDPASTTARSTVIDAGGTLASRINTIGQGVQALRTEAEGRIATMVDEANGLLASIERVNTAILSSGPTAPLADERDRLIGELSGLIDIQVQQAQSGSVSVLTGAGQTLFDGVRALTLRFDARSTLSPQTRYDTTPPSVGVLTLVSPSGQETDLVAAGAIRSGAISAAIEMRDETLVRAQRQLDELAAGLARGMSETPIDTAPGAGGSLILSSRPPAAPGTVTFPVALDVLSGGVAMRIEAANDGDLNTAVAALGAGGGYAGGTLTLPATASFVGASNPNMASGPGFHFFTDATAPYDGAGDQLTGFAQRIRVGATITPASLQHVPLAGDPARAQQMRDALERQQPVTAAAGLSGNAAFAGSVGDIVRRTVEVQGADAAMSARLDEGQRVALAAVEGRFSETSGVSIDEEMAQLVQLQTAYGANARVMSAVREMMDVLLRI